MKKLRKPLKQNDNKVKLYDNGECTIIDKNFCDGAKCVRTCQ